MTPVESFFFLVFADNFCAKNLGPDPDGGVVNDTPPFYFLGFADKNFAPSGAPVGAKNLGPDPNGGVVNYPWTPLQFF